MNQDYRSTSLRITIDYSVIHGKYKDEDFTQWLKDSQGMTVSNLLKYLIENRNVLEDICEKIPKTRDYRYLRWLKNNGKDD